MLKRIFAAMIFLITAAVFSVGVSAAWDGETIAAGFDDGTGQYSDPYKIASAEQLAFLASEINGGADYNTDFFVLSSDIDLSEQQWTPIGTEANPFNGRFDGRGFEIVGLSITSETSNQGLFGYTGAYSIISNLNVTGNITSSRDFDVESYGGIAGYNGGVIENCEYYGAIEAHSNVGGIAGANHGSIENCRNLAVVGTLYYNHQSGVSFKGLYAGGIAGYNNGSVYKCTNSGTFDDYGSTIGGIVGCNSGSGTVSYCNNTANITSNGQDIGGIAGANYYGSIEKCSNTGEISGQDYIGGIVGINRGSVKNCYSTGNATDIHNTIGAVVGGIVGENYGSIEYVYSTGKPYSSIIGSNKSGGTKANAYAGLDGADDTVYDGEAYVPLVDALNKGQAEKVWRVKSSENNGYPILRSPEHIHCTACGGVDCGEHSDDVVFEPWSDSTALPKEAGAYYLTTDVTLTDRWWSPNDKVHICLNGHVIDLDIESSSLYRITVGTSADLSLYDCSETTHRFREDKTNNIWVRSEASGEHVLTGGVITGGNANNNGGAISVEGGIFRMFGGNIVGNQARSSGAVEVCASVGIYGQTSSTPGAFYFHGGTLAGNCAYSGYGGAVYVSGRSHFYMYGGTIKGNYAYSTGGGVCIENGAAFTFGGGAITENVGSSGGGVGVYPTALIWLSGGSVVGNHEKSGNADNFQVKGTDSKPSVITVTATLPSTSIFGVNRDNGGVIALPYDETVTLSTDSFTADNPVEYEIAMDGVNVILKPLHEHTFNIESGILAESATCTSPYKYYYRCECGITGTATYTVGEPLPHNFADSTNCSFDSEQHWKLCKDCSAEDSENKEAHSGGSATCTEKAKCSFCGQPYGEVDVNNHVYGDDSICDGCGRDNSYDSLLAYGTCGGCSWTIDENGTFELFPTDGVSGELERTIANNRFPWFTYASSIKKAVIQSGVIAPSDSSYMFSSLSSCTEIDLTGLNTSKVTDMSSMFIGCTNLEKLIFGDGWDTSMVDDMNRMFSGCKYLTELNLIQGWNTSNVTDMSNMFSSCAYLESLIFGNLWDTSNVTTMSNMFNGCTFLESLDVDNGWNTSNVSYMINMFNSCSSLTELTFGQGWDTSKVESMHGMFEDCKNLKTINFGDSWNTAAVVNMSEMFCNCSSLVELNLDVGWNTSKAASMYRMFYNCRKLEILTFGDEWNTSNVSNMTWMFKYCKSLIELNLDKGWDTSKINYMGGLFEECSSLTKLNLGDSFSTSAVTDISRMFYKCSSLSELTLGKGWDTSKVTDMREMFFNCSSLHELNIGEGWNTSRVTDMSYMFRGCSSLENIVFGDGWDTSKVTSMTYMFAFCSSFSELTLDNGWDTSKVIGMSGMFTYCSNLEKLSFGNSWDTANAKTMSTMFDECTALSYIKVPECFVITEYSVVLPGTYTFTADDPSSPLNGQSFKQIQSGVAGVYRKHNWSSDWSSDSTHHWHECLNEGCPLTDNSQKDDYEPHVYSQNNVCSRCKYKKPELTISTSGSGVNTPSYTLDGQLLTVAYESECRVSYLNSSGRYTQLTPTAVNAGSSTYELPAEAYDIIISVIGDSNSDGIYNSTDLLRIYLAIAGKVELSDSERLAGDCNNDGIIDILDYNSVLEMILN